MMTRDKIKRAIAFYFSVALFLVLLPMMLSYALGYKIDLHGFKIYKTGIIYLDSNPVGSAIYIDGKQHPDLTPARIEELKPGQYKVEVRREGFYPWEKDLVVRPNMVTKEEHIILFPVVQDVARIARYPISEFTVSRKNYIYHMTDYGLFRSSMDGSGLIRISAYSNWPRKIIGKKFSSGGDKFLYFTEREIFAVYLNLERPPAPEKSTGAEEEKARVEDVLTTEYPIRDVFWYSDPNYIVVVTEKGINVVELRSEGTRNIVLLYKFNASPRSLYYDDVNDSLYFIDTRKEEGLKEGSYLYRLDLRKSFFSNIMRMLLPKKEGAAINEKR